MILVLATLKTIFLTVRVKENAAALCTCSRNSGTVLHLYKTSCFPHKIFYVLTMLRRHRALTAYKYIFTELSETALKF